MSSDRKDTPALAVPSAGAEDREAHLSVPGAVRAFHVAAATSGLQALIVILAFARAKTIAVLLEPHGVGIVGVVDQLVQFAAQLSALSLSIAPMKFVSRNVNKGHEAVNRIYQALFKSLLLSSCLGTGISMALGTGAGLGRELSGYRYVVLTALLTVPAVALTGFFSSVLASTKGYRATMLFVLASSASALVAAYAGIRLGGMSGLYYGNLIVGAGAVVGALVYTRSSLRLAPHTQGFSLREEFRRHPDILAYCAVMYLLSFAQPLSFLLVRYAILRNLGPTEAGYFHAAFAVSTVASLLLTQAIRVYLEPIANRDIPTTEKFKSANDLQWSFALLILLGALPVVVFPRELVQTLFSSAFAPAATYVFLFVVADYVFLIAQVHSTVILGLDDLRAFLVTNLSAHACLGVLAWILVPNYGLWGVAGAFLASRCVLLLLGARVLIRRYGFSFAPGLVGFLGYSASGLAVSGLFFRSASALTPLGLVSRLGVILALGSFALLFVGKEQRAWFVRAWGRFRA